MKRYLAVFLLIMAIIMIGLFSGCCDPKPKEPDVVIVLGNHANNTTHTEKARENIQETLKEYGTLRIVVVDSKPTVFAPEAETITEFYSDRVRGFFKHDKDEWEKSFKKITAFYETIIQSITANDEEVDTVKAIQQAVVALNESDTNSGAGSNKESGTKTVKKIIVYDSGLCTAGILDFTKPEARDLLVKGTTAGIQKFTDDLISAKEGIEISDEIELIWNGLSEVDGENQPELSGLQKSNLKEIWSSFLGKNDYIFKETTASAPFLCDMLVTPVWFNLDDPDADFDLPLYEEKLGGFIGDSDNWLNKDKAMAALEPIKRAMNTDANENIRFLLVGTTTNAGSKSGIPLSKKRADRVKQTLVALGVEESRMQTAGVGYDVQNKWCIKESDGKPNPKNRAVHIVVAGSEKARQALKQGGK